MQQPFDQKFCLQQLGNSTFFTPKQEKEKFNPIVHQWHTSLSKLHQKCDCRQVKVNWTGGLSTNPGYRGLMFVELVYWLERNKIPFFPRLLAFLWWCLTNLEIYSKGIIDKRNDKYSTTLNNVIVVPIVDLPSNAKQEIYQRLQALEIPCWRTRDDSVWVEISDVNIAVLVNSMVKKSVAKPQELVKMLHNCWNKDLND